MATIYRRYEDVEIDNLTETDSESDDSFVIIKHNPNIVFIDTSKAVLQDAIQILQRKRSLVAENNENEIEELNLSATNTEQPRNENKIETIKKEENNEEELLNKNETTVSSSQSTSSSLTLQLLWMNALITDDESDEEEEEQTTPSVTIKKEENLDDSVSPSETDEDDTILVSPIRRKRKPRAKRENSEEEQSQLEDMETYHYDKKCGWFSDLLIALILYLCLVFVAFCVYCEYTYVPESVLDNNKAVENPSDVHNYYTLIPEDVAGVSAQSALFNDDDDDDEQLMMVTAIAAQTFNIKNLNRLHKASFFSEF